MRLHGGKIGVQSEGEGQGCTFYIDIPISKIDRGSNYRHVSPAHKDISSKVSVICLAVVNLYWYPVFLWCVSSYCC